VAHALDELRAGGRMVGLVTHVAALAERMPVQFHVRKEAGTSRVTREEA
jgi:exonuclease SbcC